MKIHKNPKLFEFDDTENIVDVFVKKDQKCPYPFHENDWYHQGFYIGEFVLYLNFFFEKNNLPYEIIKK